MGNEQLYEWVKGNSIHNDETEECCPDFSCCNKNVSTPKDVRERFAKAYYEGDEETKMQMLGMFLGNAISTMSEKKVYIAGDTPSIEN